ncbi:DEND3-like protein [Mya arenaria]|uniref:DEND3-like protein n=1 Tax=Mya arenaria TaxID=6604 RepID=A0ABY7F6Q6_MYAAR|nr:DEND3-like protein [Mya arenaria]
MSVKLGEFFTESPPSLTDVFSKTTVAGLQRQSSRMLSFIEKDPENMQTYIKDYANILTHTPVPPAGNVAITFSVYDLPVTLMPPTHAEKSVIDLPLHLVDGLVIVDIDAGTITIEPEINMEDVEIPVLPSDAVDTFTHMFSVFLKQRMEEPSDYFTEFYMKSKGFSASRSSSSLNITSRTGRRGSLHISIKPVEVIEVPLENRLENEFSLPTIQDDLNAYTTKAAEKLSMALKNCDGHDDETSLYYLLAIFYIAKGNRVDAAECFIKVAERNNKILPERLLVQLYSEFTEEEKTTVNKKPDNEILHKIVEDSETSTSGHSEHGLLDFDSLVGEKEISNHFDTNKTLFKSLCDPHTNIADGLIGEDETILKVTPVVKSDFGIGRMFLTDKRLFFLQDVSNNYKEIVKLRDIRKLEKSEHAGLLSKTPTLTIHKKQSESHRSSGKTKKGSKKDSTFTVFLKVDRNWWYIIIQEMWAGKIVAEGLKDVMMIHHAIQSVLLIDAVIARYVYTASVDGTIIKRNVQKLAHAQEKIKFDNLKNLRTLKIFEDKLVWAGSRREGKVYVWDVRTAKHLANLDLDKKEGCKRSRGVSSIAEIDDKMWIGTKSGDIRIYDLSSRTVWKCLQAHEDAVRVLCDVRDR